jgi:signal transduction histidine kinase
MLTIASMMRQSLSVFPLAFGAALFAMGIYAAAVLTNEAVDFSEFIAALHAETEVHEIDEFLIGLLVTGIALLIDLTRNLRKTRDSLEIEHREVERSHAAVAAKAAELERTNEALRQAQARLLEMERLAAVREVVISLHHEVLNPLTGVLGSLELLKEEGAVAPHRADSLACAEQAARKIETLIKGLPNLNHTAKVTYVGKTQMIDLRGQGHTADNS